MDNTDLVPTPARSLSPTGPSLEDLVERFLRAQDVAPSSLVTYRKQLARFVSWLRETGLYCCLDTMTRETILDFKQKLIDSGLSSYSVSGYLTAVRRFFEWLEGAKIYPNVARGVKGMKKARGFRKDVLSPSQIRRALESQGREGLTGKRDFALFNLLVRTGLRTIEISRAEVGDLRQEAGEAVLFVQGKGRDEKDDFVLLTEEALAPIQDYLRARAEQEGGAPDDTAALFISHSNRGKDGPLTTRSISRIVKERLRGIGLDSKRLSAHSLRHTCGTLALKGGAPLEQVQAMLRHSDIRTTQIYVRNLDRVRQGAEKFVSF